MPESTANDDKARFLDEALTKQIASFDTRRSQNKKKAFLSKILSISFSTLTTILLGWQGLTNPTLTVVKNIALLLSAVVTILSAWESFFNHRELWVRYTSTLTRLKTIQSDLHYLLAGANVNDDKLDELYNRFQAVIDETNASWVALRKENAPKRA